MDEFRFSLSIDFKSKWQELLPVFRLRLSCWWLFIYLWEDQWKGIIVNEPLFLQRVTVTIIQRLFGYKARPHPLRNVSLNAAMPLSWQFRDLIRCTSRWETNTWVHVSTAATNRCILLCGDILTSRYLEPLALGNGGLVMKTLPLYSVMHH